MRLDTHVHTRHSGNTSIYPLSLIMRESYNTPKDVYRIARTRGMDLVTITDHDGIGGALELADRPDVIVGCEVTGVFPPSRPTLRRTSPNDCVRVHLNVLGISAAQHAEIDRLRHDVLDLMPYLRQQRIFTSLNHVASGVNGPITAPHVAALLPWVDALEINNGVEAAGAESHRAMHRRRDREAWHRRQRFAYDARHRPYLDRSAGRPHARGVHDRPLARPRDRRRT